jgi:hypothetical protein
VTFDPYRKWLGIPEGQRPPTHYQLLSISPNEHDREVINAAVVRQSAFVRNFQTGKYASEATRLLSEIAAAKVCLLDPAKRAAYDAELRKGEAAPASPSHGDGPSQRSSSATPPAAEVRPLASQTLVRQPSAASPTAPLSPTYSPPADWATGDLPGDADTPAVGEVESVEPGMSFPDALWNEVSDLPTPPTKSTTGKIPGWLWGALAGVVGLVIVVLLVVLIVRSAPPPDSPGQVQEPSETGMRSPNAGEHCSRGGYPQPLRSPAAHRLPHLAQLFAA